MSPCFGIFWSDGLWGSLGRLLPIWVTEATRRAAVRWLVCWFWVLHVWRLPLYNYSTTSLIWIYSKFLIALFILLSFTQIGYCNVCIHFLSHLSHCYRVDNKAFLGWSFSHLYCKSILFYIPLLSSLLFICYQYICRAVSWAWARLKLSQGNIINVL